MTLEEILALDLESKSVLILGCASSGKTFLSKKIDPYDFYTLHCDDYLVFNEFLALQELKQDAPFGFGKKMRIIEGGLGYQLLLDGFKDGSYNPDLLIEVVIPPAQQRLIYLRERNPEKLKHLRYYEMQNLARLNEFFRICPPEELPKHIIFNNPHICQETTPQ